MNPSIMPHLRPTLAVLLFTLIAGPAPGVRPAAGGVLDDWRELEQLADTPETRAALSREMIQAIPHLKARRDRLQLARRAFEVGSQNPQGFRWAAKALEWIQRADPSGRLWCLEQLRRMYDQATRNHPTEPKYPVALADVLEQLAEQRLLEIDAAIDAGRIDAAAAVEQLDAALDESRQAGHTLRRAASLARNQARRLRASQPAVSDDLIGLAASLPSQTDDNRALQRRLGRRKHLWMRMLDAQQRFADQPDADTARGLAMIYITDFDRPELMPDTVRRRLDDPTTAHVALACRAPGELSTDEAMTLARWYDQLARGADAESRPDMLVRTRVYFQRAQQTGSTTAKIMLVRVDQDLERAGVYAATATRLGRELTARLDFLFGPKQDPTVAVAQADAATASAPDGHRHAEHPGTDHPASGGPVITGTRYGRPMVTCDRCGREFFPGWTHEQSTCPRCRSGHRNIFDFGHGDE